MKLLVNFSISVVTVVFNGREEIAKTIKSVALQDYRNIQHIIVDGGSTDGTQVVIGECANKTVVYVSEPDWGIYDAMNKGVALATGDFLLFMNCGDVFFDNNSVSSAMRFIEKKDGLILLGSWLRQASGKVVKHCSPDLKRGIFNHQAVIYSRDIHSWHGGYVNVKGFTTADYLFFSTLFNSPKVKCIPLDVTLAVIDVNGVSSGLQTFSQKVAIDFLYGRIGRLKLVAMLLIHPVYRKIKVQLGFGN